MNKKFLILDCYVDEPACFGVPPFISPYPRYVYGALLAAGVPEHNVHYQTIDSLRIEDYHIPAHYELIFLIGGAIVPGKYLGYQIGTYQEIMKIISLHTKSRFVVGGLISHLLQKEKHRNMIPISYDIEQFAYSYVKGSPSDAFREYSMLNTWAGLGSKVVTLHPEYPDIIAEIETYRGCPREQHCSFCSEFLFKDIVFREQEAIINEIDMLIANGISRFRLGRQADILAYKSQCANYKNGFPQPDPAELEILCSELRQRKKAGAIKTLNIDNANPGTIVNFPDESARIIESIVQTITPGDTIPLGVESFDETIVQKNNLKVNRKNLIEVVSLINQIGGRRSEGLPILLPGINLIQGLLGETKNTFKMNFEALSEIKEMGLLLKRINIRKLLPFPGTEISQHKLTSSTLLRNRYEFYKEKIRKEIDHYMLTQIYPVGTLLRDVRIETNYFDYSYGRQLSSYAIITKIPELIAPKKIIDVIVIAHRERSLIALPYPIMINQISSKAIAMLPGIGKQTASKLVVQRPFTHIKEITEQAPSIAPELLSALHFQH